MRINKTKQNKTLYIAIHIIKKQFVWYRFVVVVVAANNVFKVAIIAQKLANEQQDKADLCSPLFTVFFISLLLFRLIVFKWMGKKFNIFDHLEQPPTSKSTSTSILQCFYFKILKFLCVCVRWKHSWMVSSLSFFGAQKPYWSLQTK